MISEEAALERILESVAPLPARQVALPAARNFFAAQDVFARIPLPMFDNSAMDGYAVRAADCTGDRRLRVIGEQPAGLDRKLHIESGEAVRIFTGAPIPDGADAVVMQEETEREGDFVRVKSTVEAGEFVRRSGCDLAPGQKIVSLGEPLRPASLALLAAQGMAEVTIGGQVATSILSTGDELVAPGQPLAAGQIYETNSTLLHALALNCGAKISSVEHCRDDREELRSVLSRLTALSDVLVISGGVSVGEHDLVQETLRTLGAKIQIWRVAIKPGKPFLFAQLNGRLIFGLPGNPVSAFVTWLRLVRPAMLKLSGAAGPELSLPAIPARLAIDLANKGDRRHYFRGRLSDGIFSPVGRQESHALFGLSRANALLRLDGGVEVEAGTMVAVEMLD